jgi:hypothetical protein
MNRSPRILVLAAVACFALTGAAPPHQLPHCLQGPFDGITQTLSDGTLVGKPDARDWGCVDHGPRAPHGAAGAAAPARVRIATTDPGSPAGVVTPPPSGLCMDPAAPNPASVATRIQIENPSAAHVTVQVYGREQGHGPRETALVRTLLDGPLAAGTFAFYWDLSDDHGDPLPPGIYRVVLVVGDEALCGDVEVR